LILADYHIHTTLCRHAEGEMEAYVRAARRNGLKEIGFSDHAPVLDQYDPVHRMAWEEFPVYVDAVLKLRETYPDITIRLGVEADYYPGFEHSLETLLRRYPVEYVIGSVHFMDGEAVFRRGDTFPDPKENEAFVRKYFDRLTRGVQSGLFDVLAHTDVIKWDFPDFGELIEASAARLFESVVRAGMAIELNTSGLRKKPREMYPSFRILEMACRSRIPVVPGSDAHRPEEVAADFKKAMDLLNTCGHLVSGRSAGNLMAFHQPPE